MKKYMAILLCLVWLLSLAGCSSSTGSGDEILLTKSTESTEENPEGSTASQAETQQTEAGDAAPFTFVTDGVALTPGESFDASALPEPDSTFQVPSCAIDGSDNVYNYGTFELTAYDDGSGETIYSILFIDPNLTTPEGLALGDNVEKMISLYGEDFQQEGTGYTYTSGDTQLCIIAQDDVVNSIEYLLILP